MSWWWWLHVLDLERAGAPRSQRGDAPDDQEQGNQVHDMCFGVLVVVFVGDIGVVYIHLHAVGRVLNYLNIMVSECVWWRLFCKMQVWFVFFFCLKVFPQPLRPRLQPAHHQILQAPAYFVKYSSLPFCDLFLALSFIFFGCFLFKSFCAALWYFFCLWLFQLYH